MALVDREAVVNALTVCEPSEFLEEHIFDCIPHVFADDRSKYVTWKRALSERIEVDSACLTIVGSAAVGWSLNPYKNLKQFDIKSDIDVAVISPFHFTVAWRYLRANNSRRLRVDRKTQIAWSSSVDYVYWGTIPTDRLLGVLPFGKQWLSALTQLSSIDPTLGRLINLRIYSDYESLRSYQTRSVKTLREGLYK